MKIATNIIFICQNVTWILELMILNLYFLEKCWQFFNYYLFTPTLHTTKPLNERF